MWARTEEILPYALLLPSLVFLAPLILIPMVQALLLAIHADSGGFTTAYLQRMARDGHRHGDPRRRPAAHPARLLRGRRSVRRESPPPHALRRPPAASPEPAVGAHHPDDLRVPNVRGRARARRPQHAGHRGGGVLLVRE